MSIIENLSALVATKSALRSIARLAPVVPGARIMPPSYAAESGAKDKEPRYLIEDRRSHDGELTRAVVLDSVGSSANRIEHAVLDAIRHHDGRLSLPDIELKTCETTLSSLELPHRVFDACLREGLLDGTPFGTSELGQRLVSSRIDDATALFEHVPLSLVLGAWDSHGSAGGTGTKFARALAAEIVAYGVVEGVRAAQKGDPLDLRNLVPIYEADADDASFTLDPEMAKGGAKKPAQTKTSEIGLGMVPSSSALGGVTCAYAEHQVVVSFGQLRRLSFPLDGGRDAARDQAARAVLAALAILGVELQREQGYSLRSGCELVMTTEPTWELVGRTLDDVEAFDVGGVEGALTLFRESVDRAARHGLRFAETVTLEAREELNELIRRSRKVAGK